MSGHLPEGGRSVIETRAPETIEGEDPVRARWRALDWYATAPWAARAGAELLLKIDPEARTVWEPACGDGIMAQCIVPYFSRVLATDIEPRGYGDHCDFRLPCGAVEDVDWVFTNPPFKDAAEFIRLGMERARRGVAVLCRLSFLEGGERYPLHFAADPGLAVLAPFCERVGMQLGPWNPNCSSMTAYAWFFYRHGYDGDPVVRPIPPGTERRLSLKEDIRRFVKPADAPLLASLGRITT